MANTGKLITPVQYERGLDGLNTLRPLSKLDTVRRVVSLPVVNSLPLDDSRIAQGKLLRCTQHGAVLAGKNRYYTNYETFYRSVAGSNQGYEITFSQKVFGVLVHCDRIGGTGDVRWLHQFPGRLYAEIIEPGCYMWPFTGFVIRGRLKSVGAVITSFTMYGFY